MTHPSISTSEADSIYSLVVDSLEKDVLASLSTSENPGSAISRRLDFIRRSKADIVPLIQTGNPDNVVRWIKEVPASKLGVKEKVVIMSGIRKGMRKILEKSRKNEEIEEEHGKHEEEQKKDGQSNLETKISPASRKKNAKRDSAASSLPTHAYSTRSKRKAPTSDS